MLIPVAFSVPQHTLQKMRQSPLIWLFAVSCLLQVPSQATETPGQVQSPALFNQLGDGLFVMGNVRIDSKARQVAFPATVNMQAGPLEYLIVTATGKVHESLLITEVEPYHLQAAMLLLGAKGSQAPHTAGAVPSAINREALAKLPEITGDEIQISILSKETQVQASAESWILKESGTPIAEGPWTYSGSRFLNGSYMAQELGSIASLIKDPDAMINNPRPGNADDMLWIANDKAVPSPGTAVEVTITLAEPNSKNEASKK